MTQMKLNDKMMVEGQLLQKKSFIIIVAILVTILVSTISVNAQTLPDTPFDDTALVDPDQTDFPDSTFTDEFSSIIGEEDLLGTGDTTTDTTVVTTTDTTTPTTVTDTTTDTSTPTTLVTDTPTGPETVFIFWLTFIASFGILQIIRMFSKDHR